MKHLVFGITLCPIHFYKKPAMTTEKKKHQTYTSKCAKELEAPAQMARMSGISSPAVCDCISQPEVKSRFEFPVLGFVLCLFVLNQDGVFFTLLKLYADAKHV